MFPTRVTLAVLFYCIVMGAVLVYRPRCLFAPDGDPVPFGVGRGKTVFDLSTVAAGVAVLSFALFTMVDVVAPDLHERRALLSGH